MGDKADEQPLKGPAARHLANMADAFVRASDESDPETAEPPPEREWLALAGAARRFVAEHPRGELARVTAERDRLRDWWAGALSVPAETGAAELASRTANALGAEARLVEAEARAERAEAEVAMLSATTAEALVGQYKQGERIGRDAATEAVARRAEEREALLRAGDAHDSADALGVFAQELRAGAHKPEGAPATATHRTSLDDAWYESEAPPEDRSEPYDCVVTCRCGRTRLPPKNNNGDRMLTKSSAIKRAKAHNRTARRHGRHCYARVLRGPGCHQVWPRSEP